MIVFDPNAPFRPQPGARPGLGFIPIIIAAATTAYGIAEKKKQEKAAAKEAKAAAEAARIAAIRKRSIEGKASSTTKWLWIGAGVLVVGVGAWALMRRRGR